MVEEIPNFENVLLVGRNFKGTLLLAEDSWYMNHVWADPSKWNDSLL